MNEPLVREILTALMPAWGSHDVQRIEYLPGEYAWAVAQLAIGNDRDEIRAQVTTSRDALANWCSAD